MNKKNLAVEVYTHPAIQKIITLNLVTKSEITKMIAEEVIREDEINEAPADTLRRVLNKQLKAAAEDEEKKQAILNDFFTILQSGEESGYTKLMPRFGSKTPEEKEQFYAAGKKYQTNSGPHKQIVQAIINAKSEQDVETAANALVDNVKSKTGIDLDNPEQYGQPVEGSMLEAVSSGVSTLNTTIGYLTLAAAVIPGGQAVAGGLKVAQVPVAIAASIAAVAAGDPGRAVGAMIDLIPINKIPGSAKFMKLVEPMAAIGLKQIGKEVTEEALKEFTEQQIKELIKKGVDKGVTIGGRTYKLDDLKNVSSAEAMAMIKEESASLWAMITNLFPGAGKDEVDTSGIDDKLKEILKKLAQFFVDTQMLNEGIGDLTRALGIDGKEFGQQISKYLNGEELKYLEAFLTDEDPETQNSKVEMVKAFLLNAVRQLSGEEVPGEEEATGQEPETGPLAAEEEPIPQEAIEEYEAALEKFQKKFLFVPTLGEQADIFEDLWRVIEKLSGRQKDKLDQAARALNVGTASKEEEEEFTSRTAQDQTLDEAEGDEVEQPPQQENPEDQPPAPEEEIEQPDQETKQEVKREVLERLLVLQKHANQVEEVLGIYQKYLSAPGGLRAGSKELFRRYKKSDPKELLYSLVKLIIKDINILLDLIASFGVDERTEIKEALLEIEGETFVDKIMKVRDVAHKVSPEGDILLSLLQKADKGEQQQAEPPAQDTAPPPEDNEKPPAATAAPPALDEDDEPNATGSIKEQAGKIHDLMATIKEYFPTVQPLKSEYLIGEAIEQFDVALKLLLGHIRVIARFKDDSQITKANLRSAQMGLQRIKDILLDIFGLDDEGNQESAQDADQQAAISQAGQESGLQEPTTPQAGAGGDSGSRWPGKPMNIGSPATFHKFMTSSSFLASSAVMAALNKFEQPQQKALMKFTAYLIANTADDKELKESKQVLVQTFTKALRLDFDTINEFVILLKKVDPENVAQMIDMIMNQRTRILFFLGKVAERLEEFQPWGRYESASRLELLRDLDFLPTGDSNMNQLEDLIAPFVSDEIDRINAEMEAANPDKTPEQIQAATNQEIEENPEEVVNVVVEEIPEEEIEKLEVSREDLFQIVQDEIEKITGGWDEQDSVYADPSNLDPIDFEPLMKTEMYKVFMSGNLPLSIESEEDRNKWKEALGLLNEAEMSLDPDSVKVNNRRYIKYIIGVMKWLKDDFTSKTKVVDDNETTEVIQSLHRFFYAITDAVKERDAAQAQTAVSDFIEDTKDISSFEGENIPKIDIPPPPGQDAEKERPGIKMPPVPEEISKSALNRTMKGLKSKTPGRFDVGKATQVVKDILQTRNIALKEGIGRGILTMRDLEEALIDAGAIDKDEHSTATTKLLVAALEKLGISFEELPASGPDDPNDDGPPPFDADDDGPPSWEDDDEEQFVSGLEAALQELEKVQQEFEGRHNMVIGLEAVRLDLQDDDLDLMDQSEFERWARTRWLPIVAGFGEIFQQGVFKKSKDELEKNYPEQFTADSLKPFAGFVTEELQSTFYATNNYFRTELGASVIGNLDYVVFPLGAYFHGHNAEIVLTPDGTDDQENVMLYVEAPGYGTGDGYQHLPKVWLGM